MARATLGAGGLQGAQGGQHQQLPIHLPLGNAAEVTLQEKCIREKAVSAKLVTSKERQPGPQGCSPCLRMKWDYDGNVGCTVIKVVSGLSLKSVFLLRGYGCEKIFALG